MWVVSVYLIFRVRLKVGSEIFSFSVNDYSESDLESGPELKPVRLGPRFKIVNRQIFRARLRVAPGI